MTETLHHNSIDQAPPKGWVVGMPGEQGFYVFDQTKVAESLEEQRIREILDDYKNTIEFANEDTITNLGSEFEAWKVINEMTTMIKNNPNTPLSVKQQNIISAVEANNEAIKVTFSFTEEQRRLLFELDVNAVGGILHDMVIERRTLWNLATDTKVRQRLEREMGELREYISMLDNGEATFDIASIDDAVAAFNDISETGRNITQSQLDAKANIYFAKYAKEIVTNGQKIIPPTDEFVNAPEITQTEAIDNARSNVEKKYNNELIEQIIKFTKNKTLLNTDVINGFRDVGDGSKNEAKLLFLPEDFRQYYARNNQSKDWRDELNEVIMFSDVVEQEKREVTTKQQTKGRFGRSQTTEHTRTEVVPDSMHPKMIKNELTGEDEPAVRFRYQFKYGNLANSSNDLPKYREFNGNRGGQQIIASVELPKSIADQLQKLINDNPQSVRIFVEQLFLSNNDGVIKEEYWYEGGDLKTPIRPPYEQLPEDWSIAIVTSKETVENGRPRTIDYAIDRI